MIKKLIHLIQRTVKEIRAFPENVSEFGFQVSRCLAFSHIFLRPRSDRYIRVLYDFTEKELEPVILYYKKEEYKKEEFGQHKMPKKNLRKTPIWVCWFQGEEQMPELVRMCYNSILRFSPDSAEVILVSFENLFEYIEIDKNLQRKFESGKISYAFYSDIIRYLLLRDYGGMWIDSTILVTDKISEDWINTKYYTMKMHSSLCPREVCKGRWTNFCFSGKSDLIVFRYVCDCIEHYFSNHSIIPDYIFLDYILLSGYNNLDSYKDLIDSVPYNNESVWSMIQALNDTYDTERYHEIINSNYLHKLSYQADWDKHDNNGNITFYGFLLDTYLERVK